MELDLAHGGERESFSFSERFMIEPSPGQEAPCDVTVDVEIARTGGRYLLEARVASVMNVECSRCLEPFECRTGAKFDIVLMTGDGVRVPDEVDEEDFVLLSPAEEYCYDLFPRVREAVLLEQPIRYLCREDCPGICPVCGENLNERKCSCTGTDGDPRWNALKDLLNGRSRGDGDAPGRKE